MDAKTRSKLEAALKNARNLVASIEAMLQTERVEYEVSKEIALMVAEKRLSRTCLACNKPILPGEREKRGDHSACYNTLMNRVRRGELTVKQLVEEGKILAEGKRPGRRAAIDLAEESAKSIRSKINRRHAAEPRESYDEKS